MSAVFIGVDLGTSGIRAVALDDAGQMAGSASHRWINPETDPQAWIQGLRQVLSQLSQHIDAQSWQALSVCSTSGTILAVDAQGIPLAPAWLYNDANGQAQAAQLGIPLSWGLCRWVWLSQENPGLYHQSCLAHPTDVLLQALGGETHVTDHTSALKSGFDLESYAWPTDWLTQWGLETDKFPRVVAPGTPIGVLDPHWQLGSKILLVAGLTDGCASQLAAGATLPGQMSTSVGTTLIFKAASPHRIQTADGSVYSHLHPDRQSWLTGAASSSGGGILEHEFPHADLSAWDRAVEPWIPSRQVCYPLWQPGERFPLRQATFQGIRPEAAPGTAPYYAALLEGVACVERLGLERLQQLGIPAGSELYTTGGACRSELWLRIRASLLNRELILGQFPQPAVGAAMVAAAGWWGCSVNAAVQHLFREGRRIPPDSAWRNPLEAQYAAFLDRLNPLLS